MIDAARALVVDDGRAPLGELASLLEAEHGVRTTVAEARRSGGVDDLEPPEGGDEVDCAVVSTRSGTDELSVLGTIREIHPGVPVVLLYEEEGAAARALSAGANYCIRRDGDSGDQAAHVAAAIERERNERRERGDTEFVERAFDDLTDLFFVLDMDGGLARWNRRLCEVTGYTDEEIAAMDPVEFVAAEDVAAVATAIYRAVQERRVIQTATLVTKGGERIPYEFSGSRLKDRAGETVGICVIGRDVTEREEREAALRAEQAFAENVFDTIPDVFYVLDEDGRLDRWNDQLNDVTGYSDEELAGMDALGTMIPEADRAALAAAMTAILEEGTTETRVSELITKGGERIPYEFNGSRLTDADGEPIGVAGTARDITQQQRRERALTHQSDRLRTLNHVNEVIRDVNKTLVRALTREEIRQTVCDLLAGEEAYRFAWIGEHDAASGRVEPVAWAGVEEGYLDARPGGTEGPSVEGEQATEDVTAETAVRTGEMQVAQNIAEDAEFASWREAALDRGYESAVAIPLTYRETIYGVLCVYSPRPHAFDATERDVLAELGETIAYAMSAAERRRALTTDTVVELEFALTDRSVFAIDASARADCTITLDGVVEGADGTVVEYVTVEGASPGTILDLAAEHEGIDAELITEYEEGGVFRLVSAGQSSTTVLADYGGVVREATAEAGESRLVVEFAQDADVRTIVEAIQSLYPGTELLAQRERERTAGRGAEFRADIEDALTDRQREVLKTAYLSGFFEWPRASTGEDVAEVLDIATPTFHEHVRSCERKLLAAFFEGARPEDA